MRCLTYQQCVSWCRDHGYPATEVGKFGRPAPAVRDQFHHLPLIYPKDSGAKVELAKSIIDGMSTSSELLLWVDDWAVWYYSHHMPLFTRFREAFGERRPLIEAPGHLVAREHFDDAVSVLATSLLFLWDCHVFADSDRRVYFCSHDEWNGLFTPDSSQTLDAFESLKPWAPNSEPSEKRES